MVIGLIIRGQFLFISAKLPTGFGRGYSVQALRNMRQFYFAFPNRYTLCGDLVDPIAVLVVPV